MNDGKRLGKKHSVEFMFTPHTWMLGVMYDKKNRRVIIAAPLLAMVIEWRGKEVDDG